MSCPSEETLSALLDGEVTTNAHRELNAHLEGCEACRARAERLRRITRSLSSLVLAAPAAGFGAAVRSRLGRRPKVRWAMPALAAAACVALGLLAYPALRGTTQRGVFTARGGSAPSGAAAKLGFEVFAHTRGRVPAALSKGERVELNSGFSFVVYNRSAAVQQLLLFGVDSSHQVHWFYPALPDASSDPSSVALAASPEVVPLPEGVTPEGAASGAFQFFAVFSSTPLRARKVESLIDARELSSLPDVVVHSLQVELRPVHPSP